MTRPSLVPAGADLAATSLPSPLGWGPTGNIRQYSITIAGCLPGWRNATVIGIGMFVFAWIVARACIQSITIDEADTYLAFVASRFPTHWMASSNDHILNSALIRLFTTIFGTSNLTVRLPALAGAAIYVASAIAAVLAIAEEAGVVLPLIVAVAFNPFIMDYLVAARGYSLGLGFLMCGFAIALRGAKRRRESPFAPVYPACVLCSCCAGLSFCANFSFAVVNAATLAAVGYWVWARLRQSAAPRYACVRALTLLIAPAAAITSFLAGSALLDWRNIGLTAGTTSLFKMAASVVSASLYDPNPYLLNPPLYSFLTVWRRVPFTALALATVVYGGLAFRKKRGRSVNVVWPTECAVFFGSVLVLTVAGHRLLYHFSHIPLPVDRTAVFLAPVATLFVGSIAAIPGAGRLQRISRTALAISLSAVAGYYLCCLRATHFQEWKFNAGSAPLYRFLASYRQGHQLQSISANWRYVAVLNYYRVQAGGDTIPEVPNGPTEVDSYPSGKDAYVIYYDWDRGFVGRENLRVVYRDEDTGVAVAVRPDRPVDLCRVRPAP